MSMLNKCEKIFTCEGGDICVHVTRRLKYQKEGYSVKCVASV